jgi:hypothetical protein
MSGTDAPLQQAVRLPRCAFAYRAVFKRQADQPAVNLVKKLVPRPPIDN